MRKVLAVILAFCIMSPYVAFAKPIVIQNNIGTLIYLLLRNLLLKKMHLMIYNNSLINYIIGNYFFIRDGDIMKDRMYGEIWFYHLVT
jgi:thermostable 8-oxoguanine DNA glycosylase